MLRIKDFGYIGSGGTAGYCMVKCKSAAAVNTSIPLS